MKSYVAIMAGLMVLTILTVGLASVHLGKLNLVVAIVIASLKATLVVLFFMHLKIEDRLVWGFALVPLVFLYLIILGTLVDTLLR